MYPSKHFNVGSTLLLGRYSAGRTDLLKIDELNADNSTTMYFNNINMWLDAYTPFKKTDKHKLKFKSKSWITLGLQKSISVKN